jgi:glycosyltransferase involved in cell wall biosynthesis
MLRRFLIVSTYAPPAISGAPLMAYNLLRYFPKDSFAILTSHASLDDKSIANGQPLEAKYFFFDTPTLATTPQKQEGFFWRCKRFIKRFKALRSLFHFLSLFYLPFNVVRRGKKIIEEEKIDLLLGYSDHGPALLSVYLLHKLTRKPFCLHFYDLYYRNNFPWFFTAVAYFLEPRLFRSAERISAMSEALAEHYQNKYHRAVTVLHNAIPLDSSRRPELSRAHPEPYTIVYTGTIVWAQVDAIRNLVAAVQSLSSPEVALYLYTPHKREFLESQGVFESNRVIFARGLPHEMRAIQASADILFVGLSFDTRYPLLINTSSPGKTCEYLISARPILIHAPKESYIATYARQHGFAHVVDENSVEVLKNGILRLISDQDYASALVSNAWKTALLNNNAKDVSTSFQRLLLGEGAKPDTQIELVDKSSRELPRLPYLNHE